MYKFTTKLVLKKDKPEEKYDYPVLTQHSYDVERKGEYTKFELNNAAMVAFGFKPDTPNINKINWGVDEDSGMLLLANTNGIIEDKLSNITAANTFANQGFLDKLVKEFTIDPLQVHEFRLNLQNEEDMVVASLRMITPDIIEFKIDPEEPMSDTFLEQECDRYARIPGVTMNELN